MKKIIVILSVVLFAFVKPEERPVHVFMIGDSTMSNKSVKAFPETGWGQVLHDFFMKDSVIVDNHALNGRSSKSFLGEGRWEPVISNVHPGDYVIIQFGHNDKKSDGKRHTDPYTTYTELLTKYVTETRQQGGVPILCTSIVRRHFNEDGTIINTHFDYLDAVKKLAKKLDVYFIDMEAKTRDVEENLGPQESKYLHLFIEPGIYPTRPKGVEDSTHLSQLGAYTVASLAVEGMKELDIPLIKYLK